MWRFGGSSRSWIRSHGRTIPVSLVNVRDGTLVGTVQVGSQPYSISCDGVVSNYGDNSLSIIAPDSLPLTVKKTIPNVPGSRALHGIVGWPIAWIGGTGANVVTSVDLNAGTVLTTIPVPGPTALAICDTFNPTTIFVASPPDNNIIAVNSGTLVIGRISGIPTPQDLTCNAATTGPGNSVIINGTAGGPAGLATLSTGTTVSGIFGAAGLAAGIISPIVYTGPRPALPFVLATSPTSNNLFFIQSQPPAPHAFSVSNGASFGTAQVAVGSVASAFASTGVSQPFFVSALPLPNTLGGVTLSIGGTLNFDSTSGKWVYSSTGAAPAPLSFVGPTQINFQIPPGTSLGSAVPVQLTRPDGTTLLTTLNVVATSPGIFSVLMNGQGQGAVLNQDYSLNFGTNPAPRGGVIQIYATGAGATNPPMLPGEAASATGNPLVFTQVQPTVTIGGITSPQVYYSIMAPGFPGVWQIDAQVPQNVTPGFAVPLVITAGGVSSNTVTIAVE